MLNTLKRAWLNHVAEPQRYASNYASLENCYQWVSDPWSYGTSWYEADRYRLLEELTREIVPAPAKILEVGCGEGLFTQRLIRSGYQVVGVDVSTTAISRAQERIPDAWFIHSAMEDLNPSNRFDAVIAADMLYYSSDPGALLGVLERLARTVIVSYTILEAKRMDPLFEGKTVTGSRIRTFPWNLPTPWGTRTLWWNSSALGSPGGAAAP